MKTVLFPSDKTLAERGFKRFVSTLEDTDPSMRKRKHVKTALLWTERIAAVMFIPALISSILLFGKRESDIEWKELITAPGQTESLVLADKSTIDLAPCSRLIYPSAFNGKERKVFLFGKAVADISKDPKHPFTIDAGDLDIHVHGTKFEIVSYPSDMECQVTLLEGSVSVGFDWEGRSFEKAILPGEVIHCSRIDGSMSTNTVSTRIYQSMIENGGMQFLDVPLGDIAATLSRQFSCNIIIDTPSLMNERYYASFINGEDLDMILSVLSSGGVFKITKADGGRIHLGK